MKLDTSINVYNSVKNEISDSSYIIYEDIIGKTITKIKYYCDYKSEAKVIDESFYYESIVVDSIQGLIFYFDDKSVYHLFHDQQCCEYVRISDICGDLNDLIGQPLLEAEVVWQKDQDLIYFDPKYEHSFETRTWTFYKFSTIKGNVVIRWNGESNGCYSERVTFNQIN